jgi:hypothetical protein
MALNIYFAFYKKYSVADLRSLERKYFLACYGIPLIPSITMLCIRTKDGGRIYGPAVVCNSSRLSCIFAYLRYRFGAPLTITGDIYVLSVFMDLSGTTLTPPKR